MVGTSWSTTIFFWKPWPLARYDIWCYAEDDNVGVVNWVNRDASMGMVYLPTCSPRNQPNVGKYTWLNCGGE